VKKIIVLFSLLLSLVGYSQEPTISMEAAKKQASSESKNIVLIFSGSDWCAPCIKLDRSIFQTDEFKKATDENWIVVKADFPKKKANALTAEQQKANGKLAEKYNPEGNFPKVLLLNSKGEVLGILGYEKASTTEYIEKLKAFIK
jgi:thioredoxin-related protein